VARSEKRTGVLKVRAGWREATRRAHEPNKDQLLLEPIETRFDREEWEWLAAPDKRRGRK